MAKFMVKAKGRNERGMALLLALFALLLLSAIGLCMILASDTETRIDANYSSSLSAYYAARSGLEEVRDRIKFPATDTSPGGLAGLLPKDVAGNAGGVLYVLNPAGGETVDPTDSSSTYFDDQLCHDVNSGVAAPDAKCTVLPTAPNWNLPVQFSANAATQLGYKWIRVNMKTNRTAAPYFVDQTGTSVPLDTRVCFDGQTEQLSPGGTTPACDANGMQTVYMLTSLAATPQPGGVNGARKLLRFEVVAPSIRPPGAVTMGATSVLPVLSGAGIPSIGIDGRPHNLDGTLAAPDVLHPGAWINAAGGSCSAIAPLATDSGPGTTQLEQALNVVRKSIVDKANSSCGADGSGQNENRCPFGLWWVRGTDPDPRFITSNLSGQGSGRSEDDDGHDGHDHHSDPSGVSDGICDPANPACYTNLDLSAPELFATSAVNGAHIPVANLPADGIAPFTGSLGNQIDTSIYQPGSADIVKNEIKAVNDFVSTSSDQPNYYTVSSASLAPSYGTSKDPAVVVIKDPMLSLQTDLSGYGVLVIPGALEISNAKLQWNGIVVVQSSSGHVTINSGVTGFINGALLLQPGAVLNLQNNTTAPGTTPPAFRLTYSCEAVDLPFGSKPFRIISTTETSF
jgi:hypothetical protein